jgi:hypothetical protein
VVTPKHGPGSSRTSSPERPPGTNAPSSTRRSEDRDTVRPRESARMVRPSNTLPKEGRSGGPRRNRAVYERPGSASPHPHAEAREARRAVHGFPSRRRVPVARGAATLFRQILTITSMVRTHDRGRGCFPKREREWILRQRFRMARDQDVTSDAPLPKQRGVVRCGCPRGGRCSEEVSYPDDAPDVVEA